MYVRYPLDVGAGNPGSINLLSCSGPLFLSRPYSGAVGLEHLFKLDLLYRVLRNQCLQAVPLDQLNVVKPRLIAGRVVEILVGDGDLTKLHLWVPGGIGSCPGSDLPNRVPPHANPVGRRGLALQERSGISTNGYHVDPTISREAGAVDLGETLLGPQKGAEGLKGCGQHAQYVVHRDECVLEGVAAVDVLDISECC